MTDHRGDPLFDLRGKVAFVTGAGRGLGRGLSIGLAGAGATIACAGRSRDDVAATRSSIIELGGAATHHQVDVTSPPSIRTAVREILRQHGRIDILINNAGIKRIAPALDVTPDDWDAVIRTNLTGAFLSAQAVGPHMIARGTGKIINVASTYSVVAAMDRAAYAASKGGILQLTRALALEWAPKGINVNAVGPGSIHTPMNDGLFEDDAWQSQALSRIPAGRFCTVDDVVGPVIFLASAAADMVHGQLLLVDGAFTAQ